KILNVAIEFAPVEVLRHDCTVDVDGCPVLRMQYGVRGRDRSARTAIVQLSLAQGEPVEQVARLALVFTVGRGVEPYSFPQGQSFNGVHGWGRDRAGKS